MEISFILSESDFNEEGESFWLSSTPPMIFAVGSLATDLKTAVGPLTSVPDVGELPSATGVKAFLPSGVAGTTEPFGTLAEMLEVPA